MRNIFLVKGNIIAESGIHFARNWVALAPESVTDDVVKIKNGDLILTDENSSISYYEYWATGGISALGYNQICLVSPSSILSLYQGEIERIQRLEEMNVPDHLQSTHLRHLYIAVIGALELFLTELLSCLVLGDNSFFCAFIKNSKIKIRLNQIEDVSKNMVRTVHDIIHDMNSHRLDVIKETYCSLFSIDFPPIDKMGKIIKIRHDFVHRNGYTKQDTSINFVKISNDELDTAINVTNEFVYSLYERLEDAIKQWESIS